MISLRYHVVSIGAVFLALALGVVLGSTTLSDSLLSGLSGQKDQLGQQVSELQAQRNALNGRVAADGGFATGVGALAVRGLLTQRPVVLISTPNASRSDEDGLKALLTASGATVSGEVRLTDAFSDPSRADQLRDLVTQLIPAGAQLPVASDPGTLAGGLFGALLMLDRQTNKPQATPDERASALAGLASGGFLVASNQPVLPAQLVIVLTGGAQPGASGPDRAGMLARFATQLQKSSDGAVLAGGAGADGGSGPIGVVRADTSADSVLSTVDNADTPAGRVVTVLALAEQLNGKVGAYGTAGNAQAPMPATPNS